MKLSAGFAGGMRMAETCGAVNAVAPRFFLQHIEAQMVLGAMFIGATLMSLLTARFGFTRILGLGHILRIPLSGQEVYWVSV